MSATSKTRRWPKPSDATLGLFLALLLTVFAVAPLTYPGFFQARSGFLPTFRAAQVGTAPSGSPAGSWQGEGPLPYLLAQPFLTLSGSGVVAIKWGYGLAILAGAAGAYAWGRRRLGNRGGVLASATYTYLPWHLSAIYIRGAYAEAWLWAFWPYLFWLVDGLPDRRRARTLATLAAGVALLAASFWTQSGLTILFLPLLVAYGLLTHWPQQATRHRLMTSAGRWLGGALLVLVLLLLLVAVQAVTGGLDSLPSSFSSQFLYPYQLFVDARGTGLSFQLGTAAVGLGILTLALGASRRDKASSLPGVGSAMLWSFAGALLVILGLCLPLSAPLWRAAGLVALVAQPWQVLVLTGLPLAFLAGAIVRLAPRLADLPALTGLLALVILASYPRLEPDFTAVDPGPEPVATFRMLPAGQPLNAGQPLSADQPSAETAAPQALLLESAVRPPSELAPTLILTLTWQAVALPQQALAPLEDDYTVFVHVLDGAGEKVAQRDSQPCDGACPTSSWQPGEILVDRHMLDVPADAPPGPYRLAIGLYLVDSGERAAVVGRDDRTVYLDVP